MPTPEQVLRETFGLEQFRPGQEVPMDLIEQWIDESYRAIAPKKLVTQLDEAVFGDASSDPAEQPARRARRKKKPRP